MVDRADATVRDARPGDAAALIGILNPIIEARIVGTARKHARIDGRYIDEILIEKALG